MPLHAASTGGVLAYVTLALASARCWCHGAENPLFRKAAAYKPGAGAPSGRVWVSTEQPCEWARARAGSREEEKRGLVAGSSRGAWSARVGGGTKAWTWCLCCVRLERGRQSWVHGGGTESQCLMLLFWQTRWW